MYYQLLGEPGLHTPSNYRGINRGGPVYPEHLPESHPVHGAWKEYIEDYRQQLPTKELAVRLGTEFQRAGMRYDLVHIEAMPDAPLEPVSELLGYDIAQYGSYSLLSWGLHWDSAVSLPPPPKAALFRLIEAYYRPLLNDNGLFARWSDARFFLDVVDAISTLAPGTWESPGHEQFEIVQLVTVPLDSPPEQP
jgi:hypothetical protein